MIWIIIVVATLGGVCFGWALVQTSKVKYLKIDLEEAHKRHEWGVKRLDDFYKESEIKADKYLALKKLCLDYCAKKKREKLAKVLIEKNL